MENKLQVIREEGKQNETMAQLELFSHLHAETVAAVGGASSALRIQSQLNAFAQKTTHKLREGGRRRWRRLEAEAEAEADGR